jgi:hypothetical protein
MAQRQLDIAVKVMVFGLALWGVLAGSVVHAVVGVCDRWRSLADNKILDNGR